MRGQKVMDTFYDRLKETWSYHTHHPGLPVRIRVCWCGTFELSARETDALIRLGARKAHIPLVHGCSAFHVLRRR